MADTVTIRPDAETAHALDILTQGGGSRSAVIREAIIQAGMRAERAAAMKRAILRMDLGEPDGVDIAQLLASERAEER
jgi:predicted transcriptional regulator